MKLKKYQIDAIVEEAYIKVNKARETKVKEYKCGKDFNDIMKLKKEYDKLGDKVRELEEEQSSLNDKFRELTDNGYVGLYSNDTCVESQIKNSLINKKYGKPLDREDIERKLVLADLGSDFNVEDFINDLLKLYK